MDKNNYNSLLKMALNHFDVVKSVLLLMKGLQLTSFKIKKNFKNYAMIKMIKTYGDGMKFGFLYKHIHEYP